MYENCKSKKDLFLAISAEAKLDNKEVYMCCDSFAYSGYVTDFLFDEILVVTGAKWVFSTGDFKDKKWADSAAPANGTWLVSWAKIESFGILK